MRVASWILSGFLALVAAGCGREEAPTQPVPSSVLDTDVAPLAAAHNSLDALWPNEDGRRWDYSYGFFICGPAPEVPVYAELSQVPPAPPPDEIARLLGGDRPGPPPRKGGAGTPIACAAVFGTYTLQFRGQITTPPGVTAQNLVETFVSDFSPARTKMTASPSFCFLQRLREVRPDLRPRLETTVEEGAPPEFTLPFLVHGGAWEKTAEYIGTYGDLDRSLAWKFLDADLKPGAAFDFQLVPSLADDVFLHALVLRKSDAQRVPAYSHEVEVAYVIDYGILAVIEGAADTIGYTRPVDYGSVVYVPGVGPVYAFERRGGFAGDPGRANVGLDIVLKTVASGSVTALPR